MSAAMTEVFHGVPQFLQADARIVPQLDHDCFFPCSLQFVSYPVD